MNLLISQYPLTREYLARISSMTGAAGLSFFSTVETFGNPLVEAMACGADHQLQ